MERALGFGVFVQLAAAAVVGVRLLLLARRTRQLPELALGSCFVLLGLLGYPLSILARAGGTAGPVGVGGLLGTALAIQDASAIAMGIATWQTFRRGSRTPGILLGIGGLLFAASLVGHGVATGFDPATPGGPWYYAGLAGRGAAFAWAAAESLNTFRMQQRRSRIGLADPVVTDRFRLWFLATAAITAGFGVFAIAQLSGLRVGEDARVLVATSIIGVASGTCMWLAFFPPRSYLARFASKVQPGH